MSAIETEELSLSDIYNLSLKVFTKNGCNENNATALSKLYMMLKEMVHCLTVYLEYQAM